MRFLRKTLTVMMALVVVMGAISLVPTAFAQEGLTSGTPVEGEVTDDAGNQYTLDAARGQLILLRMESEEMDAYVVISDAAGNELAEDDDSGEGDNALLAYAVQADGTYTITARGSWGDTGPYTLIPLVTDPQIMKLGQSVTVTPEAEALTAYAVFSANAGDVVDVWTETASEDDLRIDLFDFSSASIEYDDDDGAGDNALVRRVVLPESGLYLVEVTQSWDDPFTAPFTVHVDATEQLFITETPYTVVLTEDALGTEVFTFDAVLGTVYRITVTSELGTGVDMELFDTDSFFDPDFETGNAVKVTWEWQSDISGLVRIDVHPSFFSDGDNFTFMIETVQ